MRTLILGGTGMLGHSLWLKLFPNNKDTFVTVRKNIKEYERFRIFQSENVFDCVDMNDFSNLQSVLKKVRPEFILNCIGVTKRKKEIDNSVEAITLNSLLPHKLAEWARNNSAKVINFSTDCVFDGGEGNYTEQSRPNAVDLYGKTKALGEIQGSNSLTIRSSFIGTELENGTELFEWLLSQKGVIKGFKKAIYSGLTTIELGRIVENIMKSHPHISGLYNVSSDPISKYDLLMLVKHRMNLDLEIIADDSFNCDRSLVSLKFRKEFNYTPPTWKTMIDELCTSLEKGRV